jgi:hypothetical protein
MNTHTPQNRADADAHADGRASCRGGSMLFTDS